MLFPGRTQDMLDSTNTDPDFRNTIITGEESWVNGYNPETESFRHFLYNESPTRALNTTSLKCCLLTLLRVGKNSRMPMKIQGRLMQARFIVIHRGFAKKKSLMLFAISKNYSIISDCHGCEF